MHDTTASQSSQLVNKNPSTDRRAFYILSKHIGDINHQCECVVDYWLSKESSLAALWYWNWQCSYSISTANQNPKQTTCRSWSNNVTCLLVLTNLEHRHQSILFWSTSIDQLAEHRKSSAYHFAASWWVFAYLASRPLTPENIPHTKGD